MNFVIDFVEQYRFVIQIVGSIILFFFGYKIFTKETEKSIDDEKIGTTNRNLLSTYTSAFGLCFSNPIIIFLFITLFCKIQFFLFKIKCISGVTCPVVYLRGSFVLVGNTHYDSGFAA